MADYKDYYDFSDYRSRPETHRPHIELEDVSEEESKDVPTEGPENTLSDYERGRQDGFAQGREEAIAETLLTIIKAVYNVK